MICESCLYNKNCQFLLKHRNGEAEGCTAFEDKSEWVHLPVKVGDTVYQPSYKFTKCSEHDYAPTYEDDSFCYGCESNCDSIKMPYVYKGTVCVIKITKVQIYLVVTFDEKFDSSSFILGKTVFLTREEAEKVLDKQRETLNGGKIND